MKGLAVIILAAGQSTRMKSKRSKVMHMLAGRPVVSYAIGAAAHLRPETILVVRGNGQDDLKNYLKENSIPSALQSKPLGTADAVRATGRALSSFEGYVLILCADVPLIRPPSLGDFVRVLKAKNAAAGVLTVNVADPSGYGRIVRDLDGRVVKIVEDKDATEEEKGIHEINSGIICAKKGWLFKTLKKVGNNNARGEFYLTDIISMALNEGEGALAFTASPAEDFLGINTRIDLADASKTMRIRINKRHMLDGVGISDIENTFIDGAVTIGVDSNIFPYTFITGNSSIGRDCVIENGVVIKNSQIGDGVHIKPHSVIEDSRIDSNALVGPFARLRPGSRVCRTARVGNFVELKKCILGEGSKANHLTYLGDTAIGKMANIGCGTITCNYDGRDKHKTIIGDKVFVGSDVQFVAPVKIGKGAVIGAGSTIVKDVPPDSLALSRAEQVMVKGWAKKKRRES